MLTKNTIGKNNIGKNLTEDFYNIYISDDIKKYNILLIPGLFSEYFGNAYMQHNISYLEEKGINVIKLDINTSGSVIENALHIKNFIIQSKKKLIVIGHSKGGIDAAVSISKYDLYDKIHCMIFLQCPWFGTYLADDINNNGILSFIYNKFTDSKIFNDLTFEMRSQSRKDYVFDITKLKVISVYSTIKRKTLLYPFYNLLLTKYNCESDGAIAPEDAVIPGSSFIELKDIDHCETVFFSHTLSPGEITYRLINLALI